MQSKVVFVVVEVVKVVVVVVVVVQVVDGVDVEVDVVVLVVIDNVAVVSEVGTPTINRNSIFTNLQTSKQKGPFRQQSVEAIRVGAVMSRYSQSALRQGKAPTLLTTLYCFAI
jgi:hypothetical protein